MYCQRYSKGIRFWNLYNKLIYVVKIYSFSIKKKFKIFENTGTLYDRVLFTSFAIYILINTNKWNNIIKQRLYPVSIVVVHVTMTNITNQQVPGNLRYSVEVLRCSSMNPWKMSSDFMVTVYFAEITYSSIVKSQVTGWYHVIWTFFLQAK